MLLGRLGRVWYQPIDLMCTEIDALQLLKSTGRDIRRYGLCLRSTGRRLFRSIQDDCEVIPPANVLIGLKTNTDNDQQRPRTCEIARRNSTGLPLR